MQKWKEDFEKASPEKKKQMVKEMLQRLPEEYREGANQRFRDQGIEVD